jgi:hypothetical protein
MTSSTTSDKQRALIFSIIALALTALATAGRLCSLLFFYDRIGYYQSGALLPVVSNILFAASVVFFAIAALFWLKPAKTVAAPQKAVGYAALLPAIALAAYVVFSLDRVMFQEVNIIFMLSLLLAVVGAVFFSSLTFCRQPSVLSVLTGVGTILWLALSWLRSYRDFTVPMNSPDKLFFNLGCIGAVLFVFSEIRAIYGIPRPRFYYFSISTAILTLAVSSIPSLIGNACGIFASYSLTLEDFFFLALLIYAIARLLTLVSCKAAESDEASTPTDEEAQQ